MRTPSRSKLFRGASSRRAAKPLSRKLIASMDKSTPTPERIQQIAWGYAPPLILEAALNYRLFDLIDESAQTVEELAQRTGASLRGLTAILNALVGLEFL